MKVIDDLIAQNDNVVIEGVHLTVDFLISVMKKYQFCIPFVVHIKNKEKHKERFAVRSKQMTLDPKYNKYVECFENIRHIHKSFVKKAEKSLIPRIDNTNVDKSLGLIHSTIVRCLRKIVKGEPLLDPVTNKATILCQEFNAVSKSGLSSAEAQKIIKSKVNKGEIFKRFFGQETETPLEDVTVEPHPEEEGELKRVHSFDENEMKQIREETEAVNIKEHESAAQPIEEISTFDPLHRLGSISQQSEIKKDEPETGLLQPIPNKILPVLEPQIIPHVKSPKITEIHKPIVPEIDLNQAGQMPILSPIIQSSAAPVPMISQEQQAEEIKKSEKPLKTSKSSENLAEQAKKKKKRMAFVRTYFGKHKPNKDDIDNISGGDEDKNSLFSGLCSVYSGSVDVNTHGIFGLFYAKKLKLRMLFQGLPQSPKDRRRMKKTLIVLDLKKHQSMIVEK